MAFSSSDDMDVGKRNVGKSGPWTRNKTITCTQTGFKFDARKRKGFRHIDYFNFKLRQSL